MTNYEKNFCDDLEVCQEGNYYFSEGKRLIRNSYEIKMKVLLPKKFFEEARYIV